MFDNFFGSNKRSVAGFLIFPMRGNRHFHALRIGRVAVHQARGENPRGGQWRIFTLGERLREFSLFNGPEHLLHRFLGADLKPIEKAFDGNGECYYGTQKQGDHNQPL
jgi:hypothetical protein